MVWLILHLCPQSNPECLGGGNEKGTELAHDIMFNWLRSSNALTGLDTMHNPTRHSSLSLVAHLAPQKALCHHT